MVMTLHPQTNRPSSQLPPPLIFHSIRTPIQRRSFIVVNGAAPRTPASQLRILDVHRRKELNNMYEQLIMHHNFNFCRRRRVQYNKCEDDPRYYVLNFS